MRRQMRELREATLASRRKRLIRDLEMVVGVTAFEHPREVAVVVIGSRDWSRLVGEMFADSPSCAWERFGPVARGYYLGLGGEIEMRVVADWTVDPTTVAWARLVGAINATFRLRRVARVVARGLDVALKATGRAVQYTFDWMCDVLREALTGWGR